MRRKQMATYNDERKNEWRAIFEFLAIVAVIVFLMSVESIVDGVLRFFGI